MKNLIAILITVLCMGTVFSQAQTTTVTAIITDTGSQVWANGSWSAVLFNPSQIQRPVYIKTGLPVQTEFRNLAINGSGAISQAIPDNALISPYGTQWIFTFCANAGNEHGAWCVTTKPIRITGATQSITTIIGSVTKPSLPSNANNYGYTDDEVSNPIVGTQYYNVTRGIGRQFNGSTWVDITAQCPVGTGCTFSGNITAPNFIGHLQGNADTATHASNLPADFNTQSVASPSDGLFQTLKSMTSNGVMQDGWYADHSQTFFQACAAANAAGVTLQVTRLWNAIGTGTCTADLDFKTGGILKPNNVTVYLAGSVTGTVSKHFDYSLGSSSHVIGPQAAPYTALKTTNGIPVEFWGAKCDFNGTTGTDDTVAIQHALTDGRHILIGNACSLTGGLTTVDHTFIEGTYSRYISRLRWIGGTAPAIGLSTLFTNDITLKNIELDGGADSGITPNSIGVYFTGGTHYYMYDSGVINFDIPIQLGDKATNKGSVNVNFKNVEVGGNSGIKAVFANDVKFDHVECPAATINDYCLTVGTPDGYGVTAMSIVGGDLEPDLYDTPIPVLSGGINVYQVSGLTIHGIYAECDANAQPFLNVNTAATIAEGVVLTGNYINCAANNIASYAVRWSIQADKPNSLVSIGNQYLSLANAGIVNSYGGNIVTVGDVAWTGSRGNRLPVVDGVSVNLLDLYLGASLGLPNNLPVKQKLSGGSPRTLFNMDGSNTLHVGDATNQDYPMEFDGTTFKMGTSAATHMYRCLTAGTARVGTYTSVSSDCGTFVDTEIITK